MRAFLVAGLGFGDEGKGRMTDALVQRYRSLLVVRYNGGAQAAHHVTLPDGRVHCFSQFGSGTLAGAQTFLSRYVTLDLPAILREAVHLQQLGVENPSRMLYVDPGCPVVTIYERALNQLRERARGAARHGSCGRGMGEVAGALCRGEPVLRVRDLLDGEYAFHVLKQVQARCVREASQLPFAGLQRSRELEQVLETSPNHVAAHYTPIAMRLQLDCPTLPETTVFEGAQGVLLDEQFGFHPYTTWSNCTFANAETLCAEWGIPDVTRVGVTRTFHTRHGAGPFPTEREYPINATCVAFEQNGVGQWQGAFRYGYLDLLLLRYACKVVKPHVLAVSHVDCITGMPHPDISWPVVGRYESGWVPEPLPAPVNLQEQARMLTQPLQEARPVVEGMYSELVLDAMQEAAGVDTLVLGMGPCAAHTTYRVAAAV